MPHDSSGDAKPRPLVALAAGALAGVLADGLLHPMDTLRARLQTQVCILRNYALQLRLWARTIVK